MLGHTNQTWSPGTAPLALTIQHGIHVMSSPTFLQSPRMWQDGSATVIPGGSICSPSVTVLMLKDGFTLAYFDKMKRHNFLMPGLVSKSKSHVRSSEGAQETWSAGRS